jgi:hypothetical protein
MNLEDIENDKHCSYCRHYWSGNQQMYCCFLKIAITTRRKKTCKHYDDVRNTEYNN